jgi:hypothetical protein
MLAFVFSILFLFGQRFLGCAAPFAPACRIFPASEEII